MLRRSDVAMYEAKAARSGALLYDPSQDSFSRDRLQRTDELRRAIRGGQLEVWYQPEFDATTLSVISVEALVRWRHPNDGVLQPISFLPEARRHGMMNELSVEVMRMVVADARRWVDEGFTFRVSINCAPPELLGGVVLPRLYETLAETPLPPDTLVLEVTEDSFMTDPARAREQLLELRQHHVQAAIDDYGSGFSSLAYLRDLPVQELKLDRSFVSTLLTDHRSRVIVDATRQMGHALGLRIVAEGVEDAATADTLTEMQVDVLQGYHLSKPMPAAAVASWVRDWSLDLLCKPALRP
jgi:EAL domain-containing protein (putative c-di-GMP-specific phosphodiesterase class I)